MCLFDGKNSSLRSFSEKKNYGERMKRRKNDSLKEKFESLMIKTMLIYLQKNAFRSLIFANDFIESI